MWIFSARLFGWLCLAAGCSLMMWKNAPAAILSVDAEGDGSSEPCPVPRDSASYADIESAVSCALDGDEVMIGAGTWSGARNRGLEINKSLVLRGAGIDMTILDAESQGRHFLVSENFVSLTLDSVTLRGGLVQVDDAGAFAVGGSVAFGGNELYINNCKFEDNAVRQLAENALYTAGGAIFASPSSDPGNTVQIADSTFVRNTIHSPSGQMNGAAIEIGGYEGGSGGVGLLIERSSFLENRSLSGFFPGRAVVSFSAETHQARAVLTNTMIASHDGANYAFSASRAELQYSTVVGFNAAALLAFPGDEVRAIGSMILGLGTGEACLLGPVGSAGFNLDTDGTCGLADETDLSTIADPRVELVNATESQPFVALKAGSAAIDAGALSCTDLSGDTLVTDQVGGARPLGLACDIGAIEFDPWAFSDGFEAVGVDR